MEDILRDHLGKWYKTYVDWYSEWMSRWLKICLQQYSSLLFVRTFDENQCHDYERFFLLIVFITSQNKIYLHLMIFSVPYMMPTPALRLLLMEQLLKYQNEKQKMPHKIQSKNHKNSQKWHPVNSNHFTPKCIVW